METQNGKKPRVEEKKIHYIEDEYKREFGYLKNIMNYIVCEH